MNTDAAKRTHTAVEAAAASGEHSPRHRHSNTRPRSPHGRPERVGRRPRSVGRPTPRPPACPPGWPGVREHTRGARYTLA